MGGGGGELRQSIILLYQRECMRKSLRQPYNHVRERGGTKPVVGVAGGGETERELTACSGLMERSPPACDAASMKVIQTGQNQTLQEHQECR